MRRITRMHVYRARFLLSSVNWFSNLNLLSFFNFRVGDLSIIPSTMDAARDYKSAYGALCEVAVNGYLNTAFPALLGAVHKTRGAYQAW